MGILHCEPFTGILNLLAHRTALYRNTTHRCSSLFLVSPPSALSPSTIPYSFLGKNTR